MGICIDHLSSPHAINALESISQSVLQKHESTSVIWALNVSFDVEVDTPGITLGMVIELNTGFWVWQLDSSIDQIDSCCFGLSSAILSDGVETWEFRIADEIDVWV